MTKAFLSSAIASCAAGETFSGLVIATSTDIPFAQSTEPIEASDVASAIDEETLASLSEQTGLSREELVARITQALPETVDKLTPNGEMPVEGTKRTDTLLDDVPYLGKD